MTRILVLLAVCAGAVLGADITGTWKGTAETPNGSVERTFVFKQDGEKLTGETTSSLMGTSPITAGKVAGDEVSFTIMVKFQDNDVELSYKGKVTGNEIKFVVEVPAGGASIEYIAKKVS